MKKYAKMIFTFLLLFLLPLLLLKGTAAAEGVRQGLELAYRSVLPALFPAMVVCGMIGEMAEYLPLSPACTVWLTSHLCGFPLGIKTLARAYHRGLLSRGQTLRLSACCANASPTFLILYAGKAVLGSARDGLILFMGQLMISLAVAVLSGALQNSPAPPPEKCSVLRVMADSIAGAATGGLVLTGYITFFAVAAALCRGLPGFRYLYGFLELTGGLAALPQGGGRLWLAAAVAGFSGASVLLQNASFLIEERLPLRFLVLGKCVYALFLPPLALLLRRLHPKEWVFFGGIFLLFLISFDKLRKKYYNNCKEKYGGRNENRHDLFQRH